MNSILIKGASHSGKTLTIKHVCKLLKPTEVYRLDFNTKTLKKTTIDSIKNDTYLITVNGKSILVIAGSPTEQDITLKDIIRIAIELKIEIAFYIVAMRFFERKDDFKTHEDLENVSHIIHLEKIEALPLTNPDNLNSFKQNPEWTDRINRLVSLTLDNL